MKTRNSGLVTPVSHPRALPKQLTLTEIFNRKIASGERDIRSYFDPQISDLKSRIEQLSEDLQALETERDECISKLRSENARPQYTEDMCHICWAALASETLQCGHSLCTQCLNKLQTCPWDRKFIA